VAFNEIWGIKEFVNLSVDGFEVKAKNKTRQQSRGGGTIIFGKKELVTKELNTPFLEGIIETTSLLITHYSRTKQHFCTWLHGSGP